MIFLHVRSSKSSWNNLPFDIRQSYTFQLSNVTLNKNEGAYFLFTHFPFSHVQRADGPVWPDPRSTAKHYRPTELWWACKRESGLSSSTRQKGEGRSLFWMLIELFTSQCNNDSWSYCMHWTEFVQHPLYAWFNFTCVTYNVLVN